VCECVLRTLQECTRMEQQLDVFRGEVQVATVEKQRNFAAILKLQRTAKRYAGRSEPSFDYACPSNSSGTEVIHSA
jgi:hypothetical protein